MARPKSEDRRSALLDAAMNVFAEQGLAAPTSLISTRAKVSEGSFFTYFKTKDDLVNELYRDLRTQVSDSIRSGFPRRGSLRDRLEHIFDRYVTWGVEHPAGRRALRLLSMSNVIRPETREANLFSEVEELEREAVAQKKTDHLPPGMASKALKAISDMTMDAISADPKHGKALLSGGFQMLWGALTTKP